MTDGAALRPRWRMPVSTVGIPADGTSTIPLDEFPITTEGDAEHGLIA